VVELYLQGFVIGLRGGIAVRNLIEVRKGIVGGWRIAGTPRGRPCELIELRLPDQMPGAQGDVRCAPGEVVAEVVLNR